MNKFEVNEWNKFKYSVLPKNATSEQMADVKFAFYVGAFAGLKQGKSVSGITDEWNKFKNSVLPDDTPNAQVETLEFSYFTGALAGSLQTDKDITCIIDEIKIYLSTYVKNV